MPPQSANAPDSGLGQVPSSPSPPTDLQLSRFGLPPLPPTPNARKSCTQDKFPTHASQSPASHSRKSFHPDSPAPPPHPPQLPLRPSALHSYPDAKAEYRFPYENAQRFLPAQAQKSEQNQTSPKSIADLSSVGKISQDAYLKVPDSQSESANRSSRLLSPGREEKSPYPPIR